LAKKPCPGSMKQKKAKQEKLPTELLDQVANVGRTVYERATPLWSKYYKQVRKSIRFPRYYKRSLNW